MISVRRNRQRKVEDMAVQAEQTKPHDGKRIGIPRRKKRKKRPSTLVIFLMAIVLCIVFLVPAGKRLANFPSEFTVDIGTSPSLRQSRREWITEKSQPFNQDGAAKNTWHMIMVAGHSVTISGDLEDADRDEKDWFLLDYQKGVGLPNAIVAHIKAGIRAAAEDPKSLLIFSGGETRAITGPLAEGSSYFHVADAMHLWPMNSTVRSRTTTEEFATDSFENLMFSICRFKEVTGVYPSMITVVSFSFKRRRFESLHAPALGWPSQKFNYIGVDPPASSGFDLKVSTEGEYKNAAQPFEGDPYGCHSSVLQSKRKLRNPFSRTPPYAITCPEMTDLLAWCGPSLYPKETLPWNQ